MDDALKSQRWISLPCAPSSDLNWSSELARAHSFVEAGEKIMWKFELGLELPMYPLEDELRFQSAALALKQFSESVWPVFGESSLGLCLYRGSADFSVGFSWSEKQRQNYSVWLDERERVDSDQAKRVFAADAFAIYVQMLSHRLPDEVPIYLLFDLCDFSSVANALEVVSRERFEHFRVALKDRGIKLDGLVWNQEGVSSRRIESSVGLVFPEDIQFYEAFEALLKSHPNAKIVHESFLIEEWEGLDLLLAIAGSMGYQGERMAKGFIAAGGEVRYPASETQSASP